MLKTQNRKSCGEISIFVGGGGRGWQLTFKTNLKFSKYSPELKFPFQGVG